MRIPGEQHAAAGRREYLPEGLVEAVGEGRDRAGRSPARRAVREREYAFSMPDFTAMPAAATNDWMAAAYPGRVLTLPGV